jgi:sialidase-1
MNFKIILFLFLTSFTSYSQKKNNLDGDLEFVNLFSADMKAEVGCYRIPALMTAQNGDVLAVIDERMNLCDDLRTHKNINIVMRKSSDNGKTWTPIETLIDYPLGQSASDPSMLLDEVTGEIFLFFNYMNLVTEKGIYYFKMIKSKDNGNTWSEPLDITSQVSKPDWKNDFKFITSGRGIQRANGTLMHTIVNLEKGLFLFKSEDHGKTWSLLETPIKPGDESKVLELKDGSLMINSRVNKLGYRYVHTSIDNGKTWHSKKENQLQDPACNASFIRFNLDNNVLLFSNANSKNKRENLTIKASFDEGKTWSNSKIIFPGKAAYSSMTVLKNGDIGVFFEKDDYTENAFVRINKDWLTK